MTFNQPGATVAPIAVSELKNLGGDDHGTVSHDFVRMLRRDLELSGFFPSSRSARVYRGSAEVGLRARQIQLRRLAIDQRRLPGQGRGRRSAAAGVSLTALMLRRRAAAADDGQELFSGDAGRRAADGAPIRRRDARGGNRAEGSVRFQARVRLDAGRPLQGNLHSVDRRRGLFRVTDNPTINLFPNFDRSTATCCISRTRAASPRFTWSTSQDATEIERSRARTAP